MVKSSAPAFRPETRSSRLSSRGQISTGTEAARATSSFAHTSDRAAWAGQIQNEQVELVRGERGIGRAAADARSTA